jgi:hypothetical protein
MILDRAHYAAVYSTGHSRKEDLEEDPTKLVEVSRELVARRYEGSQFYIKKLRKE